MDSPSPVSPDICPGLPDADANPELPHHEYLVSFDFEAELFFK